MSLDSAEPLTPLQQLTNHIDQLESRIPATPDACDARIYTIGARRGPMFGETTTAADNALIETSLKHAAERIDVLTSGSSPWRSYRGRLARGYVSSVDGSVQPYGLVIPKSYDPTRPTRLDVVLHGSSKSTGMSELRFIAQFDHGDDSVNAPTDHDYIELHPLGRVENCYRWAGETDVFEAIEDVSRRYNIDRNRTVLRGMSMGASGTWHLGLKHPDRFVALGPYCGYVDTHHFSETPGMNFVKVGPLPEVQEMGLHMLDSVDYAANACVVPCIGAIGDKDPFFQAHVLMGEAMRREGLKMVNIISPGTAHVQDPATWAEQMRQIKVYADKGQDTSPRHIRFVTWTLKYPQCNWLTILGLKHHYQRAEIEANIGEHGDLAISEPTNITRFSINLCSIKFPLKHVMIGGKPIAWAERLTSIVERQTPNAAKLTPPGFPAAPSGSEDAAVGANAAKLTPNAERPGSVAFEKRSGKWIVYNPRTEPPTRKRPGLQGPIDDAFTSAFLCVRGTGKPWNMKVQAWADANLARFAYEWRRYFGGELPMKNDTEVTPQDCARCNLILFGDPGSNTWIHKALQHLPVHWSRKELHCGTITTSAAGAAPALICPSPFAPKERVGSTSPPRYVVINSGHTFHESELATLNYLLYPRLGDWAVFKITGPQPSNPSNPLAEQLLGAGYFNESWR